MMDKKLYSDYWIENLNEKSVTDIITVILYPSHHLEDKRVQFTSSQ